MNEKETIAKKTPEKDLLFYLRYYKKVSSKMKAEFDYQIQQIIEKLKEL